MNYLHRIALSGLLLLAAAVNLEAQVVDWQHLEKPLGGSIFYFLTAPNGNLYASTERAGMLLSTDDGQTWTRFGPDSLDEGVPTLVTPDGTIFFITIDDPGVFRS